jgi:hypothetical protein
MIRSTHEQEQFYKLKGRDRRSRAQSIYLLNTHYTVDASKQPQFQAFVQGSTGCRYTISLNLHTSSCTCPDYERGSSPPTPFGYRCKHLFFVLRNVCQLTTEQYTNNRYVITCDRVLDRAKQWCEASRPPGSTSSSDFSFPKRKNIEDGDECCICFEAMTLSDSFSSSSQLTWCDRQCGQPFHERCIHIYHHSKLKSERTCPLCRAQW